jgi:hypothetical protein
MPKKKIEYYEATEAFGTMLDGEQITVHAGELVPAGHPLLKRRMDHFKPVSSFGRFDVPVAAEEPEVEQATSEPGEKRGGK